MRERQTMNAICKTGDDGYKLDPIRASTFVMGMPMPMSSPGGGSGGAMPPRPRRSSQDEIRALLQRTTQALDKIVSIRESMEPFVDFTQFEKKPRTSSSASSSRSTTSSSAARRAYANRLSSVTEDNQEQHARTTEASSYGSTEASSISDDRSTNSTHSTTSLEDPADPTARSGSHDSEEDDLFDVVAAGSRGGRAVDNRNSDSFLSTTTEMPPLKEARLERMKDIEVTFHEGLPKEFFHAVCRCLNSTVEVKTRHSRFNFYKDAFTGFDAVKQMMVTGFVDDQQSAVRYGNVLVRLGLIEHVSRTDDQLHNSQSNFYRFTRALEYADADFYAESAASKRTMSVTANNYRDSLLSNESSPDIEYDFSSASDEVHALVTEETLVVLANVLHKVFERKNKLLFYKGHVGCFLGAEAVNVIRELCIATSLIDAVLVGQCLLDEGIIEPLAPGVTTFQDRYVFYRLTHVKS